MFLLLKSPLNGRTETYCKYYSIFILKYIHPKLFTVIQYLNLSNILMNFVRMVLKKYLFFPCSLQFSDSCN